MNLIVNRLLAGAGLLLVGCTAQAQLTVNNGTFSSAALSYDPDAGHAYSLQATLGETFVTVDPPTNSGQNLAFAGFWETGVKYLYNGNVNLRDYTGSLADYTTVPLSVRFWDTNGILADTQTVFPASNGAFSLRTWTNPSFVAFTSAKAPQWLRQRTAFTLPGDPLVTPTLTFDLPNGDVDGDNAVDINDLLALINHYNQLKNTPPNNPSYLAAADLNADGANDISDLLIIISSYNQLGGQ